MPSDSHFQIQPRSWPWLLALLAALWLVNIPIFLCQHLTPDAVMFDLQARTALEGGVLYRDILEPNLPGVVWVHMLVRSLAGWSSTALRVFDLGMLLTGLSLLWIFIRKPCERWASLRNVLLLFSATSLYFTLTEWCHCQRDAWLLPPCLAALWLHQKRITNVANGNFHPFSSLMEGMLWGGAFWIKPHVALPICCVYSDSFLMTGLTRQRIIEAALVILGGAAMGLAGSACLIASGAWPHFWDMQLKWNPEYLQSGRRKFTPDRLLALWDGFSPWSWVCIPAALLSLHRIFQSRTAVSGANEPETPREVRLTLLAALFLGWMTQTLALQHPFAYVHVPGAILALALVCSWTPPVTSRRVVGVALAGWGGLALASSPVFSLARLQAWQDCVTTGSTIEVRSRIQQEALIDWHDLSPVLAFLREQNLQDGELTAHTVGLIHLYRELDLHPPTRFVCLSALARLFPSRTEEMKAALEASGQKFVVTSLLEGGMDPADLHGPDEPSPGLPVQFPGDRRSDFPYSQSVVFRSGEYVVFRVDQPLGKLCSDYSPLRRKMK